MSEELPTSAPPPPQQHQSQQSQQQPQQHERIPFTELKTKEQYLFVRGQLSYFDVLYMPYTPCGSIYAQLKPAIDQSTKQKRRKEDYYQTQWDKQLELKKAEEAHKKRQQEKAASSAGLSSLTQAQQIQHEQKMKAEQRRKQLKESAAQLDPTLVRQFKACLELNRRFYEKRAENLDNFKRDATSIF